jgi:hypothetical protein
LLHSAILEVDTEDDDKDISENEHVGNGTFSASSTTISQSESGTPITSETEEGLEEELEKVNEEIEGACITFLFAGLCTDPFCQLQTAALRHLICSHVLRS